MADHRNARSWRNAALSWQTMTGFGMLTEVPKQGTVCAPDDHAHDTTIAVCIAFLDQGVASAFANLKEARADMVWSQLVSPDIVSVAIVCILLAIGTYFGLKRLERSYSEDLANKVGEFLLVIPLALGVMSGLNEISEFRSEQKQLRDAVRRADLDDRISITFAGVSDIARQHSNLCHGNSGNAMTKQMISELNSAHRDVGLRQNDCIPIAAQPCGPLEELARNSLIWSAAPAHAAQSFRSCEMQATTDFLSNNATMFRRSGERDQAITTSDRIRNLKYNLEQREQLTDRSPAGFNEPGKLRILGFWLIVFAASVELARMARNFLHARRI